MNKIFNTTFEITLRVLLLLYSADGEEMTLDRITNYDFITLYSKYFGLSEITLHGDNEFGLSEFASRRSAVQGALKAMVLEDFVIVKQTQLGFQYAISSNGRVIANQLKSEYATKYKQLARKTVEHFRDKNEQNIMEIIGNISTAFLRR